MSADSGRLKVYAAGLKTAGKTCSICRTVILAGEEIVYCPDCGLPFHHECWNENRGCAQYGCKSAPKTVKAETATEAVFSGWAGEKACPRCGRKIKARALKCRFCGAHFDTREEISAKEFSRREYTGKEYESSRNKTIALFLLSGTGCLSPVALVLLGILVFKGRILGMEYKRLPPALRGVAALGFGVSCLLMLVALVLIIFD